MPVGRSTQAGGLPAAAGNPSETAIAYRRAVDPEIPARTGAGESQQQCAKSTGTTERLFERFEYVHAGHGVLAGADSETAEPCRGHGRGSERDQCRNVRGTTGCASETGRYQNRQARCRGSVGAAQKAASGLTDRRQTALLSPGRRGGGDSAPVF